MSIPDAAMIVDFGGPATYRIVVQGALSDSWSERLAGMQLTVSQHHGVARTTLVGPIQDQAQLVGVLNSLYGLHLPILRIETVEEEA
jgi:hypothetical protein